MLKLNVENKNIAIVMKTIDDTPMEAEVVVGVSYLLAKYKEGLIEKGLTETMAEEKVNHMLRSIAGQIKMIQTRESEKAPVSDGMRPS